MGFGTRLLRLIRANAGYALRTARRGLTGEEDPLDEVRREARREVEEAARRRAEERARRPAGGRGPHGDDVARAYRALELDPGAGPDAIKAAHRRLLRKYHPDRHARDPEKLDDATRLSQELTRARDLLLLSWQSGAGSEP